MPLLLLQYLGISDLAYVEMERVVEIWLHSMYIQMCKTGIYIGMCTK